MQEVTDQFYVDPETINDDSEPESEDQIEYASTYQVTVTVKVSDGITSVSRKFLDRTVDADAVARKIGVVTTGPTMEKFARKFCGHQELEEPQQDLFNGDQF